MVNVNQLVLKLFLVCAVLNEYPGDPTKGLLKAINRLGLNESQAYIIFTRSHTYANGVLDDSWRESDKKTSIQIINIYQLLLQLTGSDAEVFDWMNRYSESLAGKPINLILELNGVNNIQSYLSSRSHGGYA